MSSVRVNPFLFLMRQVEKQDVVVPDEVLRVEDSISVFPKANETDEIDLT